MLCNVMKSYINTPTPPAALYSCKRGHPIIFLAAYFWLKLLITSELKEYTYITGVQTDFKICFYIL